MADRAFRGGRALLLVFGVLLALPSPARAQSADFLFRRPWITLGLRGGWAVPRAGSEIFQFTTERLTVNSSDFSSFALQGEIAVPVRDRLDVALWVGHTKSNVRSEFREFVGTDDLPIEQTTTYRRTPIEIGIKGYLRDRWREVGRLALVPYSWAPWIGVGAGWMVYDFEQAGEFADFETLDIFGRIFQTDGSTPTAHMAAGLDLSLGPHLVASGEGRYQWGRGAMGPDFVDFDRIDLSGFQITVGIAARF